MDRFKEELDLERSFRNNQITTSREFLTQLRQVYDLVNGDIGKEIFNGVILPGLLRMHGSDISTAGLEALALLAEASFMPHTQVDSFLKEWSAEKIGHGKSDIGPLESIALGSPEEGVNLTNPNYTLPILLYSNDSRFKRPSANWSPVYKSCDANRSLQLMLTKGISVKNPSIEAVIGAESARITEGVYPAGYVGEVDSNEFNARKGNDPLVIIYGLVSEADYKHGSDKEYGFLYMVTSQGTTRSDSRHNAKKAEVSAVTAVFAVLPRQNYEEIVKNQFRDVEQFVLDMLPDLWKAYLTEGGFFLKTKVIGRIDAKSPHLDYSPPFR